MKKPLKSKGLNVGAIKAITSAGEAIADDKYPDAMVKYIPLSKIHPDPNNKRRAIKLFRDHVEFLFKLNDKKSCLIIEINTEDSTGRKTKKLELPQFEDLPLQELIQSQPNILANYKVSLGQLQKSYRKLKELAHSIYKQGYLQPIEVVEHPEITGDYLAVYGHRRELAGLIALKERARCIINREYRSNDTYVKTKRRVIENEVREEYETTEIIDELADFEEQYKKRFGETPTNEMCAEELCIDRRRVGEYRKLQEAINNPETPEAFRSKVLDNEIGSQIAVKILSSSVSTADIENNLELYQAIGSNALTNILAAKNSTDNTQPIKQKTQRVARGRPKASANFQIRNLDTAQRLIQAVANEFPELNINLTPDMSLIDIEKTLKILSKI